MKDHSKTLSTANLVPFGKKADESIVKIRDEGIQRIWGKETLREHKKQLQRNIINKIEQIKKKRGRKPKNADTATNG